MFADWGFDNDLLIVIFSAVIAAISFAAFALPFLNKSEKQDHYKDVISKKRRELFDNTKDGGDRKIVTKNVSAAESMATFYKVQQMAGNVGEKVKIQLLQAGIREPKALMYYLIARIVLPIILVLWTLLLLTKADREFSNETMFIVITGIALFGFFLPHIIVKNKAIKRGEEINLTFPDSLDLMLICVQGGIGLEQTINKVADEMAESSEMLAEELGILAAEMGMLNDRRAALQDFANRVGSGAAKSFATALIQAEQYGTSVTQAMKVMASELRDARMAEAERKAAALPPKLTVPMIIFFLPALFIVILAPATLQL